VDFLEGRLVHNKIQRSFVHIGGYAKSGINFFPNRSEIIGIIGIIIPDLVTLPLGGRACSEDGEKDPFWIARIEMKGLGFVIFLPDTFLVSRY